MLINETPPKIRRIETNRDDAYAFEVIGRIESADIENLYGLLEGAHELNNPIDVLVIFHDYEGIDWSAAWNDQSLQKKMKVLKHIRKYAVVGAPAWVRAMIGLAKPFLSTKMKHFDLEEVEAAWQWIGARALPEPA